MGLLIVHLVVVPIGSSHFEWSVSFLSQLGQVAVTNDAVESIAAGPDPVTSAVIALQRIRLGEVIPRTKQFDSSCHRWAVAKRIESLKAHGRRDW